VGPQMDFLEHTVRRDKHRIYAREYPGVEPTIVLMHGFPITCTCMTVSSRTSHRGGSSPLIFSVGEHLTSRSGIHIPPEIKEVICTTSSNS